MDYNKAINEIKEELEATNRVIQQTLDDINEIKDKKQTY